MANRPADAAEASEVMDFRAQDDAWYAVRLRFEGDKLRVMYCDFSGSDEVYSVDAFALDSMDEFCKRFRPTSSQLQDNNCHQVVKGLMVCASNLYSVDDLRFYDAIVESVNPSFHPVQEGECKCKFELLWQHGPLKGKTTILGIEHMCLISLGTVINPTLDNFLDVVKEKNKAKDNESEPKLSACTVNLTHNSEPESTRHGFSPITNSACTSQFPSSTTKQKSKKPRQNISSSMHMGAFKLEQTSKNADRGRSSSESIIDNLENDVDMGGQSLQKSENCEQKKTLCFCRIDNLEKDLSPFTLIHFVQEHLGIQCSAFVDPSVSHEFCTRGFILVEDKHQAKLMDFLLNGEYIIVSLKGRPWIINDTCGITEVAMPSYEVKPSNTREELPVPIKLVHKGAAEYEKVKKLHSLHSEFLEHVNLRLLPRLLADEKKLMMQLAEE